MREMYSLLCRERPARPALPGYRGPSRANKARGIKQGIVTSKSRRGLDRVLKQFDWEDLFAVTVGADEVARGKPAPTRFVGDGTR